MDSGNFSVAPVSVVGNDQTANTSISKHDNLASSEISLYRQPVAFKEALFYQWTKPGQFASGSCINSSCKVCNARGPMKRKRKADSEDDMEYQPKRRRNSARLPTRPSPPPRTMTAEDPEDPDDSDDSDSDYDASSEEEYPVDPTGPIGDPFDVRHIVPIKEGYMLCPITERIWRRCDSMMLGDRENAIAFFRSQWNNASQERLVRDAVLFTEEDAQSGLWKGDLDGWVLEKKRRRAMGWSFMLSRPWE